MRSDKRGSVNPGLLKAGGVVLAVLIVGATGIVLYHDRQTQAAYQEWARAENKKVFDQATQQRLSDQQLLSLERQLNDSFYQRLQDQLPVCWWSVMAMVPGWVRRRRRVPGRSG